jgi:hypothetical protein
MVRQALDAELIGIPTLALVPPCLVIAALCLRVRPKLAGGLGPARAALLRWCHPGVWLLLAVACAVQAMGVAPVAKIVAVIAGACYLMFILLLLWSRAP